MQANTLARLFRFLSWTLMWKNKRFCWTWNVRLLKLKNEQNVHWWQKRCLCHKLEELKHKLQYIRFQTPQALPVISTERNTDSSTEKSIWPVLQTGCLGRSFCGIAKEKESTARSATSTCRCYTYGKWSPNDPTTESNLLVDQHQEQRQLRRIQVQSGQRDGNQTPVHPASWGQKAG